MTRATSRAPETVLAAIPPRANAADASGRGGPTTRRRLSPTIARWPLDLDAGADRVGTGDAAISIVRRCLVDYRSGRSDEASRTWHDDVAWWVPGPPPVGGEWVGQDRIFAYHALLERLSEGTFRQLLLALQGCGGSTVNAYLRTTATRERRRLDIPTLAVFELVAGRVRRVTEMPGDHDAWNAFWAD